MALNKCGRERGGEGGRGGGGKGGGRGREREREGEGRKREGEGEGDSPEVMEVPVSSEDVSEDDPLGFAV